MTVSTHTDFQQVRLAFIGGGNMASAILGGLIRQGLAPQQVLVIEPFAETAAKLHKEFGVDVHASAAPAGPASSFLAQADLVVWAVKPQIFKEAALQGRDHTANAVHLSVAAGIRSDSIAHWLGTERIVRAMPNTPALIGRGMTALFARSAVTAAERGRVEQVVTTTGELLWVAEEQQLDTVTALSGSGPAYVFYFLEAMTEAGADMGLPREQAYQLAVGTFLGAAELARSSDEPPHILRERVTSKGGTTYAAITAMEEDQVKTHFMRALHAARDRAQTLGDEFGA